MRVHHGLLILSLIHLSACSDVSQTVDDLVQTASGRITEIKHRAAEKVQPVVETINEAERRADDLQKGIEKAKEAKDLIDSALE